LLLAAAEAANWVSYFNKTLVGNCWSYYIFK